MQRQSFTEEQMAKLRENPYTKTVTPAQIRFTDQFKQEFWNELLDGKAPEQIFADKGYDLALIGEKRIKNTRHLVLKSQEAATPGNAEEKIRCLENEVRRLSFELEAVKKIIAMANSKEWTS